MCRKLSRTVLALVVSLVAMATAYGEDVIWDFENGNDHGFTLWSVKPATPAPDDPNTAGDESLTGVGGENGLPGAGLAWTIGLPSQFDGQAPAYAEGCHDDSGVLEYGPCNDPFHVFDVEPPSYTNSRGQSGYLNTYNLSQWGDRLHSASNDQIATSPQVLLGEGAVLIVWAHGGGSGTHAPELDPNGAEGYTDGSSGIAVLSAEDGSLLASVHTNGHETLREDTLDLSAFVGQKVFIEVVDAFEGSWGWLAVDEIQITKKAEVPRVEWDFENGNDHGFTLWSVVPAIPAADDPDTAGVEALTGGWEEGNPNNLPEAGVTWTIGPPTMMDGLLPGADPAHARVDANGLLNYSLGTSRMTADHVFLNTFNLNLHGDYVHTQENDQIATSPVVQLYEGAVLTATVAGSGADHEPILDEPGKGYTDGSGGIAVLSAEDGTLLASMETEGRGGEDDFILDLSAFAGQKVIIEVVDAHEGGWGWMAVDKIVITNATIVPGP